MFISFNIWTNDWHTTVCYPHREEIQLRSSLLDLRPQVGSVRMATIRLLSIWCILYTKIASTDWNNQLQSDWLHLANFIKSPYFIFKSSHWINPAFLINVQFWFRQLEARGFQNLWCQETHKHDNPLATFSEKKVQKRGSSISKGTNMF